MGYADLYPHNTFNGGGPDSMSLRFVVTDTRTTPTLVADFLAHSHADTTCQCATLEGWASDGTTRVDFAVPYNIPVGADGRFPGDFTGRAFAFQHFATLPGPGVSTATANLAFTSSDDSITGACRNIGITVPIDISQCASRYRCIDVWRLDKNSGEWREWGSLHMRRRQRQPS